MQNNPRVTNDIKKPIVLRGCMVLSVLAYCVLHRTTKIFPFPREFILLHLSFLYNIFINFNLAFYNKRFILKCCILHHVLNSYVYKQIKYIPNTCMCPVSSQTFTRTLDFYFYLLFIYLFIFKLPTDYSIVVLSLFFLSTQIKVNQLLQHRIRAYIIKKTKIPAFGRWIMLLITITHHRDKEELLRDREEWKWVSAWCGRQTPSWPTSPLQVPLNSR